jgi:hypothetical protein
MLTDAEAEQHRNEFGLLGPSPIGLDGASDRPGTATSTEAEGDNAPSEKSLPLGAGSPDSKRHIRRSLQRTLRDPARRGSSKEVHSGHSGKKSGKNDSISSTTLPENAVVDGDALDGAVERLKRHDGSFTVHGKKASVITFGGDWANLDAGERLKTLSRNESQKDSDRSSHASPPHSSITSIAEGKRAMEGGFMIAPRRSSVSLKERRVVSQNLAGADSGSELGTACSLRKFSSSSGPPVFEDMHRLRVDAATKNSGRAVAEESSSEESGSEDEDEDDRRDDDVTPRPNKLKPLDAGAGGSSIKA